MPNRNSEPAPEQLGEGRSPWSTTAQLAAWTGEFGDEYIQRNAVEPWKIEPGAEGFRRMLRSCAFDSALEVGSNIGLNLHFLRALRGHQPRLFAVEPNAKAFEKVSTDPELSLAGAWNTTGFEIPMEDSSVDLAFSAGVLIHISPEDLPRITDELVRVSRRYILCAEYFSRDPVAAPYRGHSGLLFKRDFGSFYLDRYPELKCIDYGFLWQRELRVFDDMNWWLLEKV